MSKREWRLIDNGECVFIDTPTDGTYSGLISLPGTHAEQLELGRPMVAALDMLEALQGLMERWELFTSVDQRNGFGNFEDAYYDLAKHAQEQWKAARAAIAKATPHGKERTAP